MHSLDSEYKVEDKALNTGLKYSVVTQAHPDHSGVEMVRITPDWEQRATPQLLPNSHLAEPLPFSRPTSIKHTLLRRVLSLMPFYGIVKIQLDSQEDEPIYHKPPLRHQQNSTPDSSA